LIFLLFFDAVAFPSAVILGTKLPAVHHQIPNEKCHEARNHFSEEAPARAPITMTWFPTNQYFCQYFFFVSVVS
jgi:hypothetical protein